jgi:hypothetical protein
MSCNERHCNNFRFAQRQSWVLTLKTNQKKNKQYNSVARRFQMFTKASKIPLVTVVLKEENEVMKEFFFNPQTTPLWFLSIEEHHQNSMCKLPLATAVCAVARELSVKAKLCVCPSDDSKVKKDRIFFSFF